MLLNLTQPKSIIPLVKYALGRDAHSITACFGIPHAQPSITNSDKVELQSPLRLMSIYQQSFPIDLEPAGNDHQSKRVSAGIIFRRVLEPILR